MESLVGLSKDAVVELIESRRDAKGVISEISPEEDLVEIRFTFEESDRKVLLIVGVRFEGKKVADVSVFRSFLYQ